VQLRFDDDSDRDDAVVQSFLARIPRARGLHSARGLTDEESWATLDELSRHARLDRELHGTPGLRKDWWVELAFSGRLFALGRLQFELCDGYLNVHIPETGPLDPRACDASFARAHELFPEYREARCRSWLLDPQLRGLLPHTSNIIRFHERWRLLDPGGVEDAKVLEFVFHVLDADLDRLPQETTLQRAIVAHLRAGGHFHDPMGTLDL
jgi:GNAT-like C-terminal domain/N-acyltransferase N-terminal domain